MLRATDILIIVLKRGILLIKIIQVIGHIDPQNTALHAEWIIMGLSTLNARGLVETTLSYY